MRLVIDTDDMVGIAEIAERIGVSTAAVCNWPNRHTNFPDPIVDLACGRIYDWKEIEAWAMKTKRLGG